MSKYLTEVNATLSFFVMVQNIERVENQADALSKLAALVVEEFKGLVYIEVLTDANTVKRIIHNFEDDRFDGWMALFLGYLGDEKLSMDKIEAKRVKYQSLGYTLIKGDLYKKGYAKPLLMCLMEIEAV